MAPPMRRTLALALAVGATVGCGPILYPAPSAPSEGVASVINWLGTAEHPKLGLWAAPPEGRSVVVFFHGNGSDVVGESWLANTLMLHNLGALLVEYPGYGGVPGTPSESAIYASAERALLALAERGIPRDRVVLVGQSLGTGVATEMARRGHGSRLLLISPFTSIPDVADGFLPWGVAGTFAEDTFDNQSKMRELRVETWIAHGDEDWFIPLEMGVALADRKRGAKLFVLEGAGHNDVFDAKPYVLQDLATLEAQPFRWRNDTSRPRDDDAKRRTLLDLILRLAAGDTPEVVTLAGG